MLQSDEAKTFLGDVLAAGNGSNVSDGGNMSQSTPLLDGNEDLNVSGISESDVIVSGDLSTGSQKSEANVNLSHSDISPQHEEFLTSSGESDLDRKVHNYITEIHFKGAQCKGLRIKSWLSLVIINFVNLSVILFQNHGRKWGKA